METSAIKNWLIWLGSDFGIREAHHRFRSGMKPPADYFVFRVTRSTLSHQNAVVDKEASSYDNTTTYSKRFTTQVEVTCRSENALTVLQSLDASTSAEAVRDFFGAGTVCHGLVSEILDTTVSDETYGEVARQIQYTALFEFKEMITYTRTLTNDIWDEYYLTGTLVDPDDETEHTVTVQSDGYTPEDGGGPPQ